MHFFSAKKRPKIPIFSIFNTFVQKHRNELRGYLSQRVAFQLPKLDVLIFYTTTVGIFCEIITFPKFNVPSPNFFLQSFAIFHCSWKCYKSESSGAFLAE